MSKKSKKKQEMINVLKLAVICAFTVLLVLLLRNWYLKGKALEVDTPILSGVLTHQVKANELYDYINEADTSLIYVCASNQEECRRFEKNLKTYVKSKGLEDYLIYLDLKDVSNIRNFYDELNATYGYETEIKEYPTFIFFENSSIRDVLSGREVTIKNLEKFMKGIRFIG